MPEKVAFQLPTPLTLWPSPRFAVTLLETSFGIALRSSISKRAVKNPCARTPPSIARNAAFAKLVVPGEYIGRVRTKKMTFSFSDQYDKSYMLADKEVIDLKSEPAA